jgi:hypothetical protein
MDNYEYLTNSMEPSLSCEADSRPATHKIPKLLWNAKVHYRVHNNLPLIPILRQSVICSAAPSLSITHQWNFLFHFSVLFYTVGTTP